MKLDYSIMDNVMVVKLSGRLDGNGPAVLRKELPRQLEKAQQMVLDCTTLEYMDSGGLGALLACLRIAVEQNGDIRLAEVSPKVNMLLELTRADKVFRIFPTVEEAVLSFANGGPIQ